MSSTVLYQSETLSTNVVEKVGKENGKHSLTEENGLVGGKLTNLKAEIERYKQKLVSHDYCIVMLRLLNKR